MCSNNIHHYKLLQILKYGRYGTVYKGHDFNNKCLAIKKLSLDQPIEELTAMCNEVLTIRRFKHKNIITILHCFLFNQHAYLIFPYMCFENCEMLLQKVYTSGKFIMFSCIKVYVKLKQHTYVHTPCSHNYEVVSHKKAWQQNTVEKKCIPEHVRLLANDHT